MFISRPVFTFLAVYFWFIVHRSQKREQKKDQELAHLECTWNASSVSFVPRKRANLCLHDWFAVCVLGLHVMTEKVVW